MADAALFGTVLAHAPHLHVRQRQRDHRGQFGGAVPLHRPHSEALLERVGHLALQLFGTGDHQPQAGEILPFGAPQVGQQESRRGQQQCGFVLSHHLGDLFAVHRVGVIGGREAGRQRKPERGGEAQRVEERQRRADVVGGADPEDHAQCLDVGHDVVVAEHDPLGLAGAARGEDHRGGAVGGEIITIAEQAHRPEPGLQQRQQFVRSADAGQDLLQQHHPLQLRQRGELFQEGPRGDDGGDAALLYRRAQRPSGGGVVQVDRYPPQQHQC